MRRVKLQGVTGVGAALDRACLPELSRVLHAVEQACKCAKPFPPCPVTLQALPC